MTTSRHRGEEMEENEGRKTGKWGSEGREELRAKGDETDAEEEA